MSRTNIILIAMCLFSSNMALADVSSEKPGRELGALNDACSDELPCLDSLRCADGKCAPPRVSYQTYKFVHIAFVLALFMLLGAAGVGSPSKGAKIAHGIVTLIVLVGGFGLLARLGISHSNGWPGWAKAKLALWLLIGLSPLAMRKLPKHSHWVAMSVMGLGAVAAYIVINKPF